MVRPRRNGSKSELRCMQERSLKIPEYVTMFFFMFILFRMHEGDTVTEKEIDIAIQMTLEYVLAPRSNQSTLNGQQK